MNPPQWLAFRMSGFGGRWVPGRVVGVEGPAVLVPGCQPGDVLGRVVPADGRLFASRPACEAYCAYRNGGGK